MLKPIFIENSHVVLLEGNEYILNNVKVNLLSFKEAKLYFKDLIDAKKAEIKRNQEKLTEWKNTPPFCNEATENFCKEVEIGKRKEIENFERLLKRLDMRKKHLDNRQDLNIEQAKQKPISHFLDFNGSGFAKCLWHNEKTPSMRYYDKSNSVYCFSCQEHHDVIDVVMKLNNLTFKEAIYFLTQ